MIEGKYILFASVIVSLLACSNAASSSISCIYINGRQECARQNDPNGNIAGAAAGVNGDRGVAGAGAGTQDNFNTDYQQIGYDGVNGGYGGNPDYQQYGNPNTYEGNGAGVAVGTGAGFPYMPRMIPFDGNPFKFVRDFFQGNFPMNRKR